MPDDSNVTPLRPVQPAMPAVDLAEWLATYRDHPALSTDHARTVMLMVETTDGQVSAVAQSTAPLDGFRLVGLIDHLRHRMLHGKGHGL